MQSDRPEPKLNLSKFSERTYTTFISRARAAERLSLRGALWSIALATSSTATLALSVASLSKDNYLDGKAGLIACLLSILTLVLSLVVALFNYSGRARDMFHSYRMIQRVSVEAERLADRSLDATKESDEIARLNNEYQLGLDQSENHTSLDFYRARKLIGGSTEPEQIQARKDRLKAQIQQGLLSLLPTLVIASAICLTAWVLLNP